METIRATAVCRLRNYTNDDIPALVAILNQVYADEPTTVEQEQHRERTYPAGNPRLRRVAETEDGRMAGYGSCMRPFWTAQPEFYNRQYRQ